MKNGGTEPSTVNFKHPYRLVYNGLYDSGKFNFVYKGLVAENIHKVICINNLRPYKLSTEHLRNMNFKYMCTLGEDLSIAKVLYDLS